MSDDFGPSTPAYARVRDTLRGEILSGDWHPGEHRTLSALAARYRVSISPVREALLGLEGEGLVEMRQHRGAVVPVLDATLLADLYDVRAALEGLMARGAAEKASAADLATMATHAKAFADAADRCDSETALLHNTHFHHAIRAAARNAQAEAICGARSAFVNIVRLRLGYGPRRLAEAAAEHAEISVAIAARDGEAASAAAFRHCMMAKRDLLARLEVTAQKA